MLFYTQIFLITLVAANINVEKLPTVHLNSGQIRGHYKQSHHDHTFAAFEGIPYAKPPLGKLRFAEPEPAEPWEGVRDTTLIHTCIQLSWMTNVITGNEDCLYINVYVPREKPIPNENLDVIVHIHGGGFLIGNGDTAGPEFLMDKDIVYVNFNYRLGVLGFLSTEDDVVPGNNGMKDQVLALKWIQENIVQFGGNPNSVTITGFSAGGASVHFHYFSPLSKGLFHHGISQSGVATAPWAILKAPLRRTKQIAATVGCDSSSTQKLVDCLREKSASQLVGNLKKIQKTPGFPLVLFAPVIEQNSSTAFLTDHPYNLLENGRVHDVPWISSITTEDGILGVLLIMDKLDRIDNKWNEIAPILFEYDRTVSDEMKTSISQKIKQLYFQNEKLSSDVIPEFIKLFTDKYFALNLENCARMQAKVNLSPVYSYIFGYKPSFSNEAFRKIFGIDQDFGVSHGEDGYLLYYTKFNGVVVTTRNITQNDLSIKNLMVDIVTSFAKNGYPEVEGKAWHPVTYTGDFGYLYIEGPENVGMVYEKQLTPTEFWKSLQLNEYDQLHTSRDEL